MGSIFQGNGIPYFNQSFAIGSEGGDFQLDYVAKGVVIYDLETEEDFNTPASFWMPPVEFMVPGQVQYFNIINPSITNTSIFIKDVDGINTLAEITGNKFVSVMLTDKSGSSSHRGIWTLWGSDVILPPP